MLVPNIKFLPCNLLYRETKRRTNWIGIVWREVDRGDICASTEILFQLGKGRNWIPTYLVAGFQNCGVQGTLKRYCAMGTRKIFENILELLISDKRLYFRKKEISSKRAAALRPCLFCFVDISCQGAKLPATLQTEPPVLVPWKERYFRALTFWHHWSNSLLERL